MNDLKECQLPCLPKIAEGNARVEQPQLIHQVKRSLAKPWNYYVKSRLKRGLNWISTLDTRVRAKARPKDISVVTSASESLQPGDWVRVRSREEIRATLNVWKELKGCAFLEYMWQYCDTIQRVHKCMERFLDERDYKVKKTKGIILLEDVFCSGTPVFGRCDRSCFLFWREEWLEKIDLFDSPIGASE